MLNGVPTLYIGNYYEWRVETSSSTGVNYYYAGSQRVAMRVGTALLYLFGDHLGSTSITTDASGGVSGELFFFAGGRLPRSLRFTRNDMRNVCIRLMQSRNTCTCRKCRGGRKGSVVGFRKRRSTQSTDCVISSTARNLEGAGQWGLPVRKAKISTLRARCPPFSRRNEMGEAGASHFY